MSNHFHLLLELPDRESLAPLDEEGLLAVLPLLHDDVVVEGVRQELEHAREAGDERWHREILDRYERRRGDLSLFLKELKLRVTFYMNKRLGRAGTLWEGRYKSVLVEDCERALQDPDFKSDWRRTSARYRLFLYEEGQEVAPDPERGESGRRGFAEGEVEAVREAEGVMPVQKVLRHRVRYLPRFTRPPGCLRQAVSASLRLCDGAVLGTAEFVNRVFEREQERRRRFGEKRKSGARRMRGAEWGELRVLRDLQKDVIGT